MTDPPGAGARTRRPTMKDVAALAGVSVATVSRVVGATAPVEPERAALVHDAVRRLGYRRDAQASSLRRADRASASVGLILEDVANPFFSALQRGIEDVARESGVLLFAGSSDDDAGRERQLARSFAARGVDGLIIVPASADHRYLEPDRSAGTALVFADRPPRWLEADTVLSDNAGGTRQAVEHLRAHGHTRIAYLGDRPHLFTSAERLAGYRLAGGDGPVRMGVDGAPAASAAVRELLRAAEPPSALLCAQNVITLGALTALRGLGLTGTVAVVGFDDLLLGEFVRPGLTVVAQDPVALGRTAAELLFERLRDRSAPPRHVVLPTRLIARGSGELEPPA